MSLTISIRAELIKIKRSAGFWLSLVGAGFIPFIYLIFYIAKPGNAARLAATPWDTHFQQGWQAFSAFMLPMFVILVCSLIPQIEYKNNAWKQVYASPQPIGDVFFSKYIAILLLILFLFVMYNIFMILAGVIPNLFYPKFTFLHKPIPVLKLLSMNTKVLISLMGIISIQYWFSLRFRNFIVPIGIGLALLVIALIISPWEHADKMPYAFPLLTYFDIASRSKEHTGFLSNHEWNSLAYFVVFTLIAFADMRFRKERG